MNAPFHERVYPRPQFERDCQDESQGGPALSPQDSILAQAVIILGAGVQSLSRDHLLQD